jgi:hypothetical protein
MWYKFVQFSAIVFLTVIQSQAITPVFTKCENVPASHDLKRVIWHNGAFFAVGNSSTILRSSDGPVWTKDNVDTPDMNLIAIAANGQEIVASGGQYGAFAYNMAFTDWIALTTSGSQLQTLNALVSTQKDVPRFLAAGNSALIQKSNSLVQFESCQIYLSQPEFGTRQFYGLAVDGSSKKAMAVGFRGIAAFSTDSTFASWKTFAIDSTTDMYNVRWIDNKFIAAGTKGKLIEFHSDTAYSVTIVDSSAWLSDICKTKEGYIAVEYINPNGKPRIFHSNDFADWSVIDSTDNGMTCVAQSSDSSTVVITGHNGTILRGIIDASAIHNKSKHKEMRLIARSSFKESLTHNVYDINGRLVQRSVGQGSELNKLSTGIRIIQTRGNQESRALKTFIMR